MNVQGFKSKIDQLRYRVLVLRWLWRAWRAANASGAVEINVISSRAAIPNGDDGHGRLVRRMSRGKTFVLCLRDASAGSEAPSLRDAVGFNPDSMPIVWPTIQEVPT